MQRVIAAAAPVLVLTSCGNAATDHAGGAETTQIIVHAPLDREPSGAAALAGWTSQVSRTEDLAQEQSSGLYELDGHDLAKGGTNYVFYSLRPDLAANRLKQLIERGVFPPTSIIGVARYTKDRKDWTYNIAYPAGLKSYDFD